MTVRIPKCGFRWTDARTLPASGREHVSGRQLAKNTLSERNPMRHILALAALLVLALAAQADPCTCQAGNPCLCVFGCQCAKPADPVKPDPTPPIHVHVPPVCCCAVGDRCGCAPGQCHCASAQWYETPGTNGNEFGLFKGSKQVGSYRRSDGVFLPLLGDVWGKPCKCPKALPERRGGPAIQHGGHQPVSFAPVMRAARSGGC